LIALLLLLPFNSRAAQVAQVSLMGLLLAVVPLVVLCIGYRHAHRTRTTSAGALFAFVAASSTASIVLSSMVLITLLWLPSVRATALLDPSMMADWHQSGTASFDAFLINDNLQAGLVLAILTSILCLVAAHLGGMLGVAAGRRTARGRS
jgi:hypothetical protein